MGWTRFRGSCFCAFDAVFGLRPAPNVSLPPSRHGAVNDVRGKPGGCVACSKSSVDEPRHRQLALQKNTFLCQLSDCSKSAKMMALLAFLCAREFERSFSTFGKTGGHGGPGDHVHTERRLSLGPANKNTETLTSASRRFENMRSKEGIVVPTLPADSSAFQLAFAPRSSFPGERMG